MKDLKKWKKEQSYVRIKAFDVNSRRNGPTKIASGNPADSYLISYDNQGEAVHILLDAGKPEQGEKIILPYLIENGIRKIDYLILSHMHLDHFGGMLDILKDSRVTVENFVYAPMKEEKIKQSIQEAFYDMWLELKQRIREKVTHIQEIGQSEIGQQIHIADHVFFDIISVPNEKMIAETEQVDLNECNLVLNLNFHKFTALFPGDCGEFQANDILHSPQKEKISSVSVLKAGHHGGDNSTSAEFIDFCNPKIVLIPCNETVVEHRPSFIQKLHEFSRNGAKVFRADRCHDLILETDGYEIACSMETEKYVEEVTISI